MSLGKKHFVKHLRSSSVENWEVTFSSDWAISEHIEKRWTIGTFRLPAVDVKVTTIPLEGATLYQRNTGIYNVSQG